MSNGRKPPVYLLKNLFFLGFNSSGIFSKLYVIEMRLLQIEKASKPITVRLSGRVMEVRLLQ